MISNVFQVEIHIHSYEILRIYLQFRYEFVKYPYIYIVNDRSSRPEVYTHFYDILRIYLQFRYEFLKYRYIYIVNEWNEVKWNRCFKIYICKVRWPDTHWQAVFNCVNNVEMTRNGWYQCACSQFQIHGYKNGTMCITNIWIWQIDTMSLNRNLGCTFTENSRGFMELSRSK